MASADVVTLSPGGLMVSVIPVLLAFCAGVPASVTLKVSGAGPPCVVGVPVMAPDELSVSPPGSVPAVNCQLYAPVPPVAASVTE